MLKGPLKDALPEVVCVYKSKIDEQEFLFLPRNRSRNPFVIIPIV